MTALHQLPVLLSSFMPRPPHSQSILNTVNSSSIFASRPLLHPGMSLVHGSTPSSTVSPMTSVPNPPLPLSVQQIGKPSLPALPSLPISLQQLGKPLPPSLSLPLSISHSTVPSIPTPLFSLSSVQQSGLLSSLGSSSLKSGTLFCGFWFCA